MIKRLFYQVTLTSKGGHILMIREKTERDIAIVPRDLDLRIV